MKEVENCLNAELWHACAGGIVQMPTVNSQVYYFPQGHAEHALGSMDFVGLPRVPAFILCQVSEVKFMADSDSDEVYAKIGLIPITHSSYDCDKDGVLGSEISSKSSEKPSFFAKTLTQSDANNGGGFSVPRYCAETIFPRLDYSADPPIQTLTAKDVHGTIWKFRHIYRGTPRRHLLTTGWSTFVNQKKLIAGDSIVFMKAENGDVCVGIRRAKRGGIGGPESPSIWSSAGNCTSSYGSFSVFLREDENMIRSDSHGNSTGRGKVRPESVFEAMSLAASRQPFEVVYYPRASTPEFCVKASSFNAAMAVQWCSGMRFKMPFETEDSSRISWFMGTVTSVQVADPFRWPNSPWRILQVTWDEPDLLQNVKQVSPWLVELVSNMPPIHPSPFLPQRKKLRLPQPPDFPVHYSFQIQSFSGNPQGTSSPFHCLSGNIPAGIQGARHAHFGIPFLDLQSNNKPHLGVFPSNNHPFIPSATISGGTVPTSEVGNNENLSCLLSIGNSVHKSDKSNDKEHAPLFLLFGQPILTEQQISRDFLSDKVSQVQSDKNSDEFLWNQRFQTAELGLEAGHCKVFLESDDAGKPLDLSVLGSYEELHARLSKLFGIGRLDNLFEVLYEDAMGVVKQTGDEPFSEFAQRAKSLKIVLNSHSNPIGRKWVTGLSTTEHGLEPSNQTGPVTIFAL